MSNDEIKKLFEKLKNDKKAMVILAIGLTGMLLILFSGSSSADKNKPESPSSNEHVIYSECELAQQIEKLIENIDGAGKCKAMVSYSSYEETVYARNENQRSGNDGENQYVGEYIVLDSGSEENGLAVKILLPEIKGVAIVCQGGNNPVIKEQIISALSALFNISTNRISVAVMAK